MAMIGGSGGPQLTVANQTELVNATQSIANAINAFQQTFTKITASYIASGTYTPTLTPSANFTNQVASAAQYCRVGSVVTVSGTITGDVAAAVATTVGISLPIASNIGAVANAAGTAALTSGTAARGAAIIGDVANDRATMSWVASGAAAGGVYAYLFLYQII